MAPRKRRAGARQRKQIVERYLLGGSSLEGVARDMKLREATVLRALDRGGIPLLGADAKRLNGNGNHKEERYG